MHDTQATDTIAAEGAPPSEPASASGAAGPALMDEPMGEDAADTEGACASRADTAALQEGSADTRRDALGAASATPDEPDPDAAEDPTVILPLPVAAVEPATAADLADDTPRRILPATAAGLSEEETLRQPAIAAPRRVPRYSQPLRDNPFFLYRTPDLLRDANDPSLPPPPGLKWAYDRRQVRWYLRSTEEGLLASRPWIWVLLLLAGVFALTILSRLIGG